MTNPSLNVRELTENDIDFIADYWLQSDKSFLQSMGVDTNLLPSKDQLSQMLNTQINTPLKHRLSYCIIWELDGQPVGHCNTNPTFFGHEAFMHLHLWNRNLRQRGLGTAFLRMTLPYFFDRLKLSRLLSEPYALNDAPNSALQKVGFVLVKKYTTVPGSINFEQPVNRWEMTFDKYWELRQKNFSASK